MSVLKSPNLSNMYCDYCSINQHCPTFGSRFRCKRSQIQHPHTKNKLWSKEHHGFSTFVCPTASYQLCSLIFVIPPLLSCGQSGNSARTYGENTGKLILPNSNSSPVLSSEQKKWTFTIACKTLWHWLGGWFHQDRWRHSLLAGWASSWEAAEMGLACKAFWPSPLQHLHKWMCSGMSSPRWFPERGMFSSSFKRPKLTITSGQLFHPAQTCSMFLSESTGPLWAVKRIERMHPPAGRWLASLQNRRTSVSLKNLYTVVYFSLDHFWLCLICIDMSRDLLWDGQLRNPQASALWWKEHLLSTKASMIIKSTHLSLCQCEKWESLPEPKVSQMPPFEKGSQGPLKDP